MKRNNKQDLTKSIRSRSLSISYYINRNYVKDVDRAFRKFTGYYKNNETD